MKFLIDTDIASCYLRRQFSLFDKFQNAGFDNLCLSIVTLAEMRVMPYRKPSGKLNFQVIDDFAAQLGVLWPDARTWELFSEMKAKSIDLRNNAGDLDIIQAAFARQHNLIVVTRNLQHFIGLAPTEDWSSA